MSEEKLTWWLDDPRPSVESAPYTYFVPSKERILALEPGDLAQLIFAGSGDHEYGAERMWVEITMASEGRFAGKLANEPIDMPQIEMGERISFDAFHIINIEYTDENKYKVIKQPPRREYWDRCLVDQCVLDGETLVEFIYREEPDMGGSDKYPDSGWRIRGDMRGCTDEEMEAREAVYVALGAVLNRDDSWLHLIDENWPCRFMRNWATGEYEHE